MKQILLRRGQVTIEQIPAPLVEPGHVLVEVAYSLISAGTETSNIETSRKPLIKRGLEQPDRVKQVVRSLSQQGVGRTLAKVRGQLEGGVPLGYSCSGTVLQVGAGVDGLRQGDPVACAGAKWASHAEIILVPRNLVVKAPENCDLQMAASVTLGAIALQGVRRADLRLGETAAVIGLGLLGQIAVQLLKAAGCRVIGFDLDPRRVELALQLGAHGAFVAGSTDMNNEILHRTTGYGVDATIITASSSSDAIVQQAMEITRKKGRVVLVGDVGLGLKRSPFYEKEIDFLISCSYGPGRYDTYYETHGQDYPYAYVRWTENRNMAEYLRLIAEGKVQVKPILEREYDLSDAARAYEELRAGDEKPLGVLLRYPVETSSMAKQQATVMLQDRRVRGRIKVALVGAGSFAKSMHLPNLQQLSAEYHLRAVVDSTGSNAKATAQQFGADYATTDFEEVLRDPEVDALIICTRHNSHASMVKAALSVGKHVYCEKPLALNDTELDGILSCYGLSLAEIDQLQANRLDLQPILMVGFNRRYAPAALQMKKILLRRQNPLMALYRVSAGYLPSDSWVHGPEGGGRIVGEMCHMFDLFSFLVGSPAITMSIEPLSAYSQHLLASDNIVATLKYADGSVCTLFYTALGASGVGKEYVEVHMDGKTLVLDDFKRLQVHGSPHAGWSGAIADKGHKRALQVFASSIASGQWDMSLGSLMQSSHISITAAEAAKWGPSAQGIG